jgi:hypothetical protein
MATYKTYDEVGVKEDVSDVITNISPTKTPFQSSLKTEKIHQKTHQWQEDQLDAPADNAQVEGFDAVDGVLVPTSMRSNTTQIFTKTVKVSGSADATLAHGRAKETAYQMTKKSKEIKRDFERTLVGVAQAAIVGDDNTARKMASAFNQLDAGGIVSPGTAAALSEANLLTALGNLYTAGGEATIIQVKPTDSVVVADFAKAAGRYRTFDGAKDRKLVNAVDIYVSPFGEQKVVINRFQLATAALLYDPSNWRILVFRNWFRETLAKTGDATKMMIVGEFSLKHVNFKASGAVENLL